MIALRFQSSPVPENGCNTSSMEDLHQMLEGFNPHPSRRTGATAYSAGGGTIAEVFQSSPVPENGCNVRGRHKVRSEAMFQSSPVPENGCNMAQDVGRCDFIIVSILTRPGERVQRLMTGTGITPCGFQSSPVPENGCNHYKRGIYFCRGHVSILTRPGERVQPAHEAVTST